MTTRRPLSLDAIGVGLAAGFLLALAAGAMAGLGDGPSSVQPDPAAPADPALSVRSLPPGVSDPIRRTAVVEAVNRVAPAVVSITTEVPSVDPFFRLRGGTESSEGSGVVIDSDGIVLTNAHVVERASRIVATMADGRAFEADIIGLAHELDLAVLRLRGASALASAPHGTSADLMLGEPVVAIGNPFGLGHTVTSGVISAVSRPLATDERVYQDFIQTDASINPGNSGGPLINARGQLVGINTAVRADGQGIGFAIPADRALKVARDLSQFGQVQVPWLGLDLSDVVIRTPEGRVTAPRVDFVHPGTPAAQAGIERGAVLVSVDGRSVQGRADLNAFLSAFDPGHEVTVELLHGGRKSQVQLVAGRVPEVVVDRILGTLLGAELVETAAGLRVRTVHPAGAFAKRGLRAGDLVVAFNGSRVDDLDALRASIAQAKSGHRASAMWTLRRGDHIGRLPLPL